MSGFSDSQIEEVRARADIVEVIGAHVRLRKAGRNYVGLCPFHNEKTPSFSVNRDRGFFHCFGCGAGGSVFNFIIRVEGLTFPEAVRTLARRFGVSLPERGEGGPAAGERETMARANEVACAFFEHVLWKTPEGELARRYLEKRGITEATARNCRLGFAPLRSSSLARALERRALTGAGLKLGLLKAHEGANRDMFFGRLMFPIRDGAGKVVAFGGRVLDQRLPKYINSPESPLYSKARSLYGLYEARAAIAKADRAIVVEGYIDAIALWQAGFGEAVAGLGTALTADQLRLLGRYTRNVLACFDGDAAGQTASLRALRVFLEAGLLAKGIVIPAGFDPDTLVRERGARAFAELADSALLLVDYFLQVQARQAVGSLAAKSRAAENVVEILRLVQNPFEFDLLVRKAAGALEVGEQVLRDAARARIDRPAPRLGPDNRRPAGPAPSARSRPTRVGPLAVEEAPLALIAIAISHPGLRDVIAREVPLNWIAEESLRSVLARCCGSAAQSEQAEEIGGTEQSLASLDEGQRRQVTGLLVDERMTEAQWAAAMLDHYRECLEGANMNREVRSLTRAAGSMSENEAIGAAQTVIELRRAGSRSSGTQ